MMDRESKHKAHKQIEALRKNPPKVTAADWAGAKALAKKEKARQDKIDHDIDTEVKAIAKDMGSYTYGVMAGPQGSGVRKFHGFGEGKVKRLICAFCEEHCSDQWHYVNDRWWGSEHKQFSGLPEQERERLCLSQKKTSQLGTTAKSSS